MTINLSVPDIRELKPRITVFGVGGAGGNAVNNMIEIGLQGCEFVVGNTDAQALTTSKAHRVIQMGVQVTEGLGAGSHPEVGRAAAEEVIDEIRDQLSGAHMVFVTAGMGGGTGTGAAPVVARAARDMGILTVGVVTKPFHFEGSRRMRLAEQGIIELQKSVDTLIVIPNQNLFRVANEQTTFADAFAMADRVLYSGVACITDLMVKEGLINLDFADVRAVMREMGKAMMGTGEASGEKRALRAAEAAIANPLLDDVNMAGARGLLISITGGSDLTLYEVDEAATRIREEVDPEANVIFGATRDDSLEGIVRVSVVATGIDYVEMMNMRHNAAQIAADLSPDQQVAEIADRFRQEVNAITRSAPQVETQRQPMLAQGGGYAVHAAPAQQYAPQQPSHQAYAPQQAPQAYAPQAAPAPTYVPQPPVSYANPQPQPRGLRVGPDLAIRPAQRPVQPEPVPAPAQAYDPAPAEDAYLDEHGFVPPVSERPVRPVRMPDVNDFPPIMQRSMDQGTGMREQPAPTEKKRQSLIERLTHAGFGKKIEGEQAPRQGGVFEQSASADQRRPSQAKGIEDDQLEIPAFLRRQSN